MNRPTFPWIAAALLACFFALLIYANGSKDPKEQKVDQVDSSVDARHPAPAPLINQKLSPLGESKFTSLSQFKGKVVLLNFWAKWCDACADEAPTLVELQKRLKQDGRATLVGITYNEPPTESLKFLEQFKLNFDSAQDFQGRMAAAYGVRAAPETFAINAKGQLVAITRQPLTMNRAETMLKLAGITLKR